MTVRRCVRNERVWVCGWGWRSKVVFFFFYNVLCLRFYFSGKHFEMIMHEKHTRIESSFD